MIELRYYQTAAVNAVYDFLRRKPDLNPCVVLPTGAGKSLVIAKIVSDAVTLWEGRVLILAHVKELLEQNAAKIQALCPGLEIGVYSAGLNRRDTGNRVVVAGIQSVHSKAADLGSFDLILVDEAHLIPPDGDGMYQTFLNDARAVNDNVRLIGLTATPYRLRGGLICKPDNLLNEICYEVGVKELIYRGYLSKLVSKNGQFRADLEGLHVKAGEFVAEEVAERMDNASLVENAVWEILKLTKARRKVLIFASSVAHAQHVKKAIEEKGQIECGIVVGNTPKAERDQTLDRFKDIPVQADLFGNMMEPLKYLVNVGVLTTGFDAPQIDCVVLLRPTASAGLYYQMVGRGFRLSPGKVDCMILDYGQNIMRHGPVDMIQVSESRCGKGGTPPMRECPQCHSVFPAGRITCPDCGFEMPRPERDLHHGVQAASDGILSDQASETEYEVRRVRYAKHYKKGADNDTPPTLRVEYQIGFNDFVSEWVCIEHTGYAGRKAEAWWGARTDGHDLPISVDEAIWLAENGYIKEPSRIKVRKTPGDKWPRIIDATLEEPRNKEDYDIAEEWYATQADATPFDDASDESEIPF